MYERKQLSWVKHADFVFLDIVSMTIAYVFAYLLRQGTLSGFMSSSNINTVLLYFVANILTVFTLESYKNILKRGYYKEFTATLKHALVVTLIVSAILFILKDAGRQSRLIVVYCLVFYLAISYGVRLLRKQILKKHVRRNVPVMLLVTTEEKATSMLEHLEEVTNSYNLKGLVILDKCMTGQEINGIPVVADKDTVEEYTCREWVDEVFFDLGDGYVQPPQDLVEHFLQMGITTHTKLYRRDSKYEWDREVEHLGPYMVLTRTIHVASSRELLLKRALDILGALAGLFVTGLVALYVVPKIKKESPGPAIYKQTRIGKNGKQFKMYKFRSMYLDADERKKELMEKNRVGSGLMFKLDWDPRIIGNKELPDGTRATGIGEFIRKTSLDEFPQFLNVLKGDMSLVGTRPPTLDEWEKYDLHHRARMATKPGVTGMWQVSGRSEITDFEEVVRLDTEYISKWNIGLDIKILFQTVKVVLQQKGSM